MSASVALAFFTARAFPDLLSQSLGTNFGSVFPAIPFAALLALIFVFRWKELARLLASEEGLGTLLGTRALGAALLTTLIAGEPLTSTTVETSGIALVLTFLGSSLIINPKAKTMVSQYAAIYSVGIGSPALLEGAFGQPLAMLSSDFASKLVSLAGLPVTWQGTQFVLISHVGGTINGVVTPGCSSVISVTTFLGLLALMHLDLKKDVKSTLALALVGVGVLVLLNSVRILLLMWVGFQDGAAAFWGIHDWLGYAIFVGFYLAILPIYSRMSIGTKPTGLALAN